MKASASVPLQLDAYAFLEGELWFAKRLGEHGMEIVFGGDSPSERRARIRAAILHGGLSAVIVGKSEGRAQTYAQAFQRLYGEAL